MQLNLIQSEDYSYLVHLSCHHVSWPMMLHKRFTAVVVLIMEVMKNVLE